MAKDNKDAAIRKRQLIARANQTMFIAVAIASVVIGLTSVLTTFLVREMMFNFKVLDAQNTSIKTLKTNLENVKDLETKMEELQTNSALLSSRADVENNALRVVIDALPSFENSAALGASVSDKLLSVPGIKIESITVDTSASSAESATGAAEGSLTEGDMEAGGPKPQPIEFSFTVTSDSPENILNVIKNLEKSIRTINITSFKLDQNTGHMSLAVNAQAFYLAQAKVVLREKVIKSDDTSNTSTEAPASQEETTGGQ
ncbi:MAG: hypothetical protein KIG14_01855 [Candidatus Sacchiramonaceae bacterium]|nr:hypothetical protein [Candidatus Saccharimonadaceae bacterium]